MQIFDLGTFKALFGFSNDMRQEIALQYYPKALNVKHELLAGQGGFTRCDGMFPIYLTVDATKGDARYSWPFWN